MMSVPPDCISSSTWSTLPRNVLPWVPWVSIISRGFTPEKALPSLTITMDMLTWFQCLDFFWLLQFLSTYPTFWVNCWDKLICCRKTQFRSYHPSLIWFLEDRAQKIHQNSLVESWNHGTAEPTSSTRGCRSLLTARLATGSLQLRLVKHWKNRKTMMFIRIFVKDIHEFSQYFVGNPWVFSSFEGLQRFANSGKTDGVVAVQQNMGDYGDFTNIGHQDTEDIHKLWQLPSGKLT